MTIVYLDSGDRAEWLEQRKSYCTASDIPALLGESRWKTRDDVIAEKQGRPNTFNDNSRMYFGRIGEAHVLQALHELTGITVTPNSKLAVNSEVEGLAATPDALADMAFHAPEVGLYPPELIFHSTYSQFIEHQRMGSRAVVDVKVVASKGRSKWKQAAPPEEYYGQLQAQMLVCGLTVGLLVAKVDAAELYGYVIEADPFYQDLIKTEVSSAWKEIRGL